MNNRQFLVLVLPPDPSEWSSGGNGGGGYGGGLSGADVPDFEGGQEGAAPDPKPRSRILTENERLVGMALALAPAAIIVGIYVGGAYAVAVAESGGAAFAKGEDFLHWLAWEVPLRWEVGKRP